MKSLLVVVFLLNGEWTTLDGWHPIEVDTVVCEERKEMLETQLRLSETELEWHTECVPQ